MTSYRVKRRAFLAGLGGAVGLQALLSGMEASAQGVPPPPRLLVMQWPLGTLRQRFLPTATGVNDGFVTSPLLEPFEKAGLHDYMSVLYGLSHNSFKSVGGGGNEAGTVFAVTGANSPGTRSNGGEGDDAVAGGPSFDQIFLKRVAELQRPGVGYVNAIADARVFSFETSTQCLSYAHETRAVPSGNQPGSMVTEHVPLMAETQPLALYNRLFSSVAPGVPPDAARKALLLRKSVLDYALAELKRLQSLAPASERVKVDVHADAIRKLELQLQAELDGGSMSCVLPAAPNAALKAKTGSAQINMDAVAVEDASLVAAIGKAHAAVIRAAFQCDLVRVATLQWCSGTNHVAFAGMNPDDPAAIYEMGSFHYRSPGQPSFFAGPPPSGANAYVYETLFGMFRWLNQQTADVVGELKAAKDIFGGSLLDSTIVPYITDQADPSDQRAPLPALILGGLALGMQGGKFLNFPSGDRSHNDLWLTIAQAFLKSSDPLAALTDEKFIKTGVATLPGLWAPKA